MLFEIMTEENNLDNRFHIKLKRHFVKHWKRLHSHVKKHHKKYVLGSVLYSILHLSFFHILALKFFGIKFVLSLLTLVWIYNHSLSDIFAKMDNICIDKSPIIVWQSCEKDFDTIQDAVSYLESMIDPETDNIYNAQYYGIIQSMLGEYCDTQIDKDKIKIETKKLYAIAKIKDVNKKLNSLKEINQKWKQEISKTEFSWEVEFCQQQYLAYDMLDLSQKLFLKQLKRSSLMSPNAILSGQNLNKKADRLLLANFSQWKKLDNKIKIKSTLWDLQSTNANTMANIIKNIGLVASDEAINALDDMGIFTDDENKEIKDKLELRFVSSCSKNQWYHRIKQYYDDKDVLQNTTLEEIKIDIGLCNSYQYIDQLDQQVKKLLIHEIWHYMYYFKDKSSDKFETICRNKRWSVVKNKCGRNEFVSNYSQTNAEEDYAETFSRRAMTQINQDKKYLSYYRNDIEDEAWDNDNDDIVLDEHSASLSLDTDDVISQKFNYFDGLVKSTRQIATK